MKRLKGVIKTAAVFLMAGSLFFSCALDGTEDHGTLLVILPGPDTAARAAISETFTASLGFQLDCDGPGGNITGRFNSGERAAVSLSPGNWTVTVGVINAAGETIGDGSAEAVITAGKTTSVQIPVAIDTSRKDITSFAITSPVSAEGKFSPDGTAITVYVPAGTTGMDFTLIHTGRSVNPAPETPLNFDSPQTFTVTAEDSSTRTYTVTVIALAWPAAGWAAYGLAGLTQPAGTTIVGMEEDNTLTVQYDLSVTLDHIDNAAYENLRAQIQGHLGNPVSAQNQDNGTRTDKFEKPDGLYTIRVRLDTQNDEISIRADKRLLSAVFPPAWW